VEAEYDNSTKPDIARVSRSKRPLNRFWETAAEDEAFEPGALFLEARTAVVTVLLVIPYCAAQQGICCLQGAPFLLGEVRILERGKNVIEFCFQFLKLGT